jgi:hypothetical protein
MQEVSKDFKVVIKILKKSSYFHLSNAIFLKNQLDFGYIGLKKLSIIGRLQRKVVVILFLCITLVEEEKCRA